MSANGIHSNKEIVREIGAYLARTGKKQYEVAAEIGIPPQTLNRWLNGKAEVSKAYQTILRSKGIVP